MEKYNTTMDIPKLSPNNSLVQALSYIKMNSKILECGCASGYVTKYLKENLNCNVSIIEIDEICYNKARQYAKDGFNGNLNEQEWFNYYKNQKFDYILFTEVLEHLTQPKQTLLAARELLKPEGKIIITIPNICHNDIFIRMFYNYFTYTSTGLLDDTHIHFWGLNDIEPFCNSAGLKVLEIKTSNVNTCRTEQASIVDTIDPDLLKLLLEKRQYGTVYQYIIYCEKS